MYTSQKTFVNPEMRILDLLQANPSLLLLIEHFEIDFCVKDKTIVSLCEEKDLSQRLFVQLCNLYNGFALSSSDDYSSSELLSIISYLKNCHKYYKDDKYPEIKSYIDSLIERSPSAEVVLIGKFFDEYFCEVKEHLDYEEDIAFPYFISLINEVSPLPDGFSAAEYREHHSDIEYKLSDLKNLLLRHLCLKNEKNLHRKLLTALFMLESDLNMHSQIEELMLVPAIDKIEKRIK